MTIFKAFLSLLIIALLVVMALFVDFTYKTFSAAPRLVQSDAIVVLAGGRGRIEEGVRLFREGKGNELFLVGVDPLVRKSDLYRPAAGDPPYERVILEKTSRNTLENAIFARDILVQHNVRSILLITSRYHLKRAAILFRHALPRDVAIYPYPVDSINVKERWWQHEGSFKLLFSEFYKYCLFRIFFLLAPGELRPVKL
ncbi:YdcF family protein [Trichlorobacter ammonificans]|uniref:DUF218 domain-containing protein n=1 Tax=Trichlorobacter ammonificans TaxID=2916410 RepID=A0ABM9D840_9BACT|nr:YdcF family protein [Trichlorobacter ammonificans]CAH2031317.1 conserved protein of unknown function [Trichlorobacter ammonificans]